MKVVVFTLFSLLCLGTGQAQLTPPLQDYVLRFSGQEIALAPDDPNLDLDSTFTMMGWFNVDDFESGRIFMGRMHDPWLDSPGVAYTIGLSGAGDRELVVQVSDGSPGDLDFVVGGAVAENEWMHVAAVLGQDTLRLYQNGELIGTTYFPHLLDQSPTRFAVGGGATEDPILSYGSGFSGYARHLSLWNIALDKPSIERYAREAPDRNSDGLIAFWKLDEALSDSSADSGPHGLHLRFDRTSERPTWRETDPIGYLEEAVGDPFFGVSSFSWFEAEGIPDDFTPQDVYPIDFDHDGRKDVIVSYVRWPATDPPKFTPLHALKNNGDGTFSDVSEEVLQGHEVILARFGLVVDLNGDGLEDLILVDSGTDCCGSPGHQNTYLLGHPDGTLKNVSESHLPLFDDANHALDVGDIDNDGDLDVVSGQQGRPLFSPGSLESLPEVFVNDGTGRFARDYSRLPQTEDFGQITVMGLIDLDRDGWKDVVLANAYSPESEQHPRTALVKMQNDGHGSFLWPNGSMFENEITVVKRPEGFDLWVDILVADFDADGWQDAVVSRYLPNPGGGAIDLYLSDRDGGLLLQEGAISSPFFGPADDFWFIYIKPADFNGDGWLDLFIEGQEAGDLLFLNAGDGTFVDASYLLSPSTMALESASAVADFTGDGRPDIFSMANGRIQLLTNRRSFTSAPTPLPVPVAPALTAPETASSTSVAPQISWQRRSTHALSHIQLSQTPDFEPLVNEWMEFTGSELLLDSLQEGETYHWRVRGINTAGPGEWSEANTFTIGPATGVPINDGADHLPETYVLEQNYPNPFNPSTSIRYGLPTAGDVQLTVYDVLGRKVATLIDERQAAGFHEVRLNLEGAATGVYTYRLTTGRSTLTRKSVLVR